MTTYRKKGRSKQLIALMMVLFLSLGQMAIALANSDDGPVLNLNDSGDGDSSGDGVIINPNDGVASPSGGLVTDGDGGVTINPNDITLDGTTSIDGVTDGENGVMQASGAPVFAPMGGSVTPTLVSGQWYDDYTMGLSYYYELTTQRGAGEYLQDGDKIQIVFQVAELEGSGSLKAGLEIVIDLPGYMQAFNSSEFNTSLQTLVLSGALAPGSGIVSGSNGTQLKLIVGTSPDNSTGVLSIGSFFDIEVRLDQYTGSGQETIMFNIGGLATYQAGTGGTGGGGGTGSGAWESYGISKFPRSNFNNGYISDSTLPVGFEIFFKMPDVGQDQYVDVTDIMSSVMSLCDSNGDIGAAVTQKLFLYQTDENWADIGPVYFNNGGAIEATENPDGQQGFNLRFTGPYANSDGSGSTYFRLVYFAKLNQPGYVGGLNNSIAISFNNSVVVWDELVYGSGNVDALMISKRIKSPTSSTADEQVIVVDETNPKVTFEVLFYQVGDGRTTYPAGRTVATDTLHEAFVYDGSALQYLWSDLTPAAGGDNPQYPFVLDTSSLQTGREIQFKMAYATKLWPGTFRVRFGVDVDMNKLLPGQRASNVIKESTVWVYRDAKLHVDKTWQSGTGNPQPGSKITFELRDSSGYVLSNAELVPSTPAQSATLYVGYMNPYLKDGTHTYYLYEVLSGDSDYGAESRIPIEITKDTVNGTVTFSGADGTGTGERTVAFTNKPDDFLGEIEFTKRGSDGSLLNGGKFQLTWLTDRNGAAKNQLMTLNYVQDAGGNYYAPGTQQNYFSVESGKATIKSLEYGTYRIDEIEPPAGYLMLANASVTVTIGKGAKYVNAELTNPIFDSGRIKVLKKDQDGAAVSGVPFELKKQNTNGLYVSQGTKTTDANGVVEWTGLTKGNYQIIETVSSGFEGAGTKYTIDFTIDENGETLVTGVVGANGTLSGILPATLSSLEGKAVELTWSNKKLYAAIEVLKVDSTAATQTPLSGAEFTLHKANAQGNATGAELARKTTGGDGKVLFDNLEYGNYVVTEVTAPPGYSIGQAKQVFLISESTVSAPDYKITYTWGNPQQSGSVKVQKKGEGPNGSSINLGGVWFGLYDQNGAPNPIQQKQTSDSGVAEFTGLLKGTYWIKEMQTVNGYVIGDDTYHEVKIGENNSFAQIVLDFDNPRDTREVEITKTAEDTKAAMRDVVFKLFGTDFSGAAYEQTQATNILGLATFTKVPYGNYTITEVDPPAGYARIPDITGITVDKNSTAMLKYAAEDPAHELTIQKTGSAADGSKIYLADAEFILQVGSTTNYVKASMTSPGVYKYEGTQTKAEAEASPFVTVGAEGKFTITHIPAATYRLWETEPPPGFVKLTNYISVTVSANTAAAYREVSNSTITGGLKIIKKDDKGKLLPGMEFLIEGPNGYSQTFVTDGKGEITVSGLLYGDYTITEINTPPEYVPVVDAFTISANGVVVEKELVNLPMVGAVRIKKADRYDGTELGGAVFNMYPVDDQGNLVTTGIPYTAISNATGDAVFSSVPYGFYGIVEVQPPVGYLPDSTVRYVSVEGAPTPASITDIVYTELVTIPWPNDKVTGSLTVQKTDGSGPLPGATFKLYYRVSGGREGVLLTENIALGAGRYTYAGTGALADATEFGTDGVGKAIVEGLPHGIYELIEEACPDGHEKDTTTHVIYVSDIEPNPEETVKNPPKTGKLEVTKVDAITGDVQFGAVIRIYDYNGSVDPADYTGKETWRWQIITDFTGKGAQAGIPFGEYVAIEEVPPAGYLLGDDADRVFRFTISASDPSLVKSYTYENEPLPEFRLRIVKVDQDDHTTLLAGAKFKVVQAGTGWGPDPDTLVTDQNGEIVLNGLSAGSYTVEEWVVPDGYAIGANSKMYITKQDGSEEELTGAFKLEDYYIMDGGVPTVTVKAENEKILGSVELTKVDENNDQMDGAKFQLEDGSKNVLKLRVDASGTYDYVLDPNGSVTDFTVGKITIGELPAGDYVFRELEAPKGYAMVGEEYGFSVNAQNYTTLIRVQAQNLPIKSTVALRKVDEDNNNVVLPDAAFTLYRSTDGGSTYTEEVEKDKKTNASGVVHFTDLLPGHYRIEETTPPPGYILWTQTIDFEVNDEGKIVLGGKTYDPDKDGIFVATVENRKSDKEFALRKIDSASGTGLEGAVFSLTDGGGSVIHTLVTNSSGVSQTVKLPVGTYTLRELIAPDGYQLLTGTNTVVVSDTGITVDGTALTGTPLTFTVRNTRVTYQALLYKTDSSSGNPLSGATFSVTPRNGATGTTLVTGASGQSNVVTLTAGTYDIVETVAPSGYTRPLSGWTVVIASDGTPSVTGSGISTWSSGNVIVINITNTTTTTTTTPTPTPTGGITTTPTPSGGTTTRIPTGGGTTSTTPAQDIPLGPGLPQTGDLTTAEAALLGSVMALLLFVSLLLFVALGGKKEDDVALLPALM